MLEVAAADEAAVLAAYAAAGVPCAAIGATAAGTAVSLSVGGQQQVAGTTPALRDVWEATSFQLERLQAAEENVEAEQSGLASRVAPQWRVPFTPAWTPADKLAATGALPSLLVMLAVVHSCCAVSAGGLLSSVRVLQLPCGPGSHFPPHPLPFLLPGKVKVAIIREEGSNGDREMAAAVYAAGMEPWDVHMSDLLSGTASLDAFQGIVFVGGFRWGVVLVGLCMAKWADAGTGDYCSCVLPRLQRGCSC